MGRDESEVHIHVSKAGQSRWRRNTTMQYTKPECWVRLNMLGVERATQLVFAIVLQLPLQPWHMSSALSTIESYLPYLNENCSLLLLMANLDKAKLSSSMLYAIKFAPWDALSFEWQLPLLPPNCHSTGWTHCGRTLPSRSVHIFLCPQLPLTQCGDHTRSHCVCIRHLRPGETTTMNVTYHKLLISYTM